MASTIWTYPVQRQRLPEIARRIAGSSGVGSSRWATLPVADASDVIPRWLRDIAMCRQVDAWRRSLEPREPLPAVPAGIGSRLSWATARNAGQVTAALGGRVVYGRFEAPCPWCVRQGRESKSGRMSLVVWDDALDIVFASFMFTVDSGGATCNNGKSCNLGDVPVFQTMSVVLA